MNIQRATLVIATVIPLALSGVYAQTTEPQSRPARTEVGFTGGVGVFTPRMTKEVRLGFWGLRLAHPVPAVSRFSSSTIMGNAS